MKLSALLSVHPPTNSLPQSEISCEREDIKVKPLAIYEFDGDPETVSSYKSLLGLASGPLIGALFIMTQGFSFIINLATIALIIALLFGAYVGMKKEN